MLGGHLPIFLIMEDLPCMTDVYLILQDSENECGNLEWYRTFVDKICVYKRSTGDEPLLDADNNKIKVLGTLVTSSLTTRFGFS